MKYLRAALCWIAWATLCVAHGPYHEEMMDLTAVLEKHPHDLTALLRRGELFRDHARYGETNDLAAARSDFQRVLERYPRNVSAQLGLARVEADTGAFTHALNRLEALLSVSEQVVSAHLLRAEILVQCGQSEQAVAAYSEGLRRLKEPRPETYLARARAQLVAEPTNFSAALSGLDEGIARLGQVPGLQLLALDLATRAGDFEGALQRLDQLAATSERQETWLARRGDLLQAAGRFQAARAAWAQALGELGRLPERLRGTLAHRELHESLTSKLADKFAVQPPPPQFRIPNP